MLYVAKASHRMIRSSGVYDQLEALGDPEYVVDDVYKISKAVMHNMVLFISSCRIGDVSAGPESIRERNEFVNLSPKKQKSS
jgi:hypothetical protein